MRHIRAPFWSSRCFVMRELTKVFPEERGPDTRRTCEVSLSLGAVHVVYASCVHSQLPVPSRHWWLMSAQVCVVLESRRTVDSTPSASRILMSVLMRSCSALSDCTPFCVSCTPLVRLDHHGERDSSLDIALLLLNPPEVGHFIGQS